MFLAFRLRNDKRPTVSIRCSRSVTAAFRICRHIVFETVPTPYRTRRNCVIRLRSIPLGRVADGLPVPACRRSYDRSNDVWRSILSTVTQVRNSRTRLADPFRPGHRISASHHGSQYREPAARGARRRSASRMAWEPAASSCWGSNSRGGRAHPGAGKLGPGPGRGGNAAAGPRISGWSTPATG